MPSGSTTGPCRTQYQRAPLRGASMTRTSRCGCTIPFRTRPRTGRRPAARGVVHPRGGHAVKTILLLAATLVASGAAAQTPPEGVFEGRMITFAEDTPSRTVLMVDGDQRYGAVAHAGETGWNTLLGGEP